jgi:hypothetical protein
MRYRRLGEREQEVPVACTDRGLVDLQVELWVEGLGTARRRFEAAP